MVPGISTLDGALLAWPGWMVFDETNIGCLLSCGLCIPGGEPSRSKLASSWWSGYGSRPRTEGMAMAGSSRECDECECDECVTFGPRAEAVAVSTLLEPASRYILCWLPHMHDATRDKLSPLSNSRCSPPHQYHFPTVHVPRLAGPLLCTGQTWPQSHSHLLPLWAEDQRRVPQKGVPGPVSKAGKQGGVSPVCSCPLVFCCDVKV